MGIGLGLSCHQLHAVYISSELALVALQFANAQLQVDTTEGRGVSGYVITLFATLKKKNYCVT